MHRISPDVQPTDHNNTLSGDGCHSNYGACKIFIVPCAMDQDSRNMIQHRNEGNRSREGGIDTHPEATTGNDVLDSLTGSENSATSETVLIRDKMMMTRNMNLWPKIKSLRNHAAVHQMILITFTCGIVSTVVGIASLMEPAKINARLPFCVFYPIGTIMMYTIFFLKFPADVSFIHDKNVSAAIHTVLLSIPVVNLILVLLILPNDNVTSLLSAGSLFLIQMALSFVYVFLCMRDLKY